MRNHACISECKNPLVPVEDAGVRAVFCNPKRKAYRTFDVDGCLVTEGLAADFAVEELGTGLAVVELKGRNVEHALKQVSETVKHFRDARDYTGRLCALIVSRQSPLGSATIAKQRLIFAKRHGGAALHVHSSQRSFVLSDLLTAGRRK